MQQSGLPTSAAVCRSQGSAVGRLATGGLSVLVALALVVNLTCKAAGPVFGSLKESSSERLALRHLSEVIHRVVRRLIRRNGGTSAAVEHDYAERYGQARARFAVIPAEPGRVRGLRLDPRLMDLPPPRMA